MEDRWFKDLGYYVVAKRNGDYCCEFSVYTAAETSKFDSDEVFPTFGRCDDSGASDWVDSVAEADLFMHGEVKWDGCSNWHIDEQDRVMLHECDREGLLGIGEVMARCWDWAGETLPNWDGWSAAREGE